MFFSLQKQIVSIIRACLPNKSLTVTTCLFFRTFIRIQQTKNTENVFNPKYMHPIYYCTLLSSLKLNISISVLGMGEPNLKLCISFSIAWTVVVIELDNIFLSINACVLFVNFFIYSNHTMDEFVLHLKTITCINYRTQIITESCQVNGNTAFRFI